MPFSTHMWFQQLTFLDPIRPNDFLVSKSNQGILRYVHFLALAYVAYAAVTALGPRLSGWFVDICCKVGQQSLVVFLASMFLAQGLGTLIYLSDRNLIAIALVNLIGFALLVGVAHIAGWFKATPWKLAASHRSPGSQGSPGKPQGRRRSADRSRNAAMDQPRNPDLAGATAAE
jgi:hypothetical protein